jgi:stringent starvation protein B
MPQPLPPKKEVALALLERSKVHIHLDPRKDGVVVPAHFRKQPQLVLEIGLNMPIPIPDLRLDEEGMTCTLSFSRQPFYCAVPWPAVFAMLGDDGRGMVWPDDVPRELQPQVRMAEAPPKLRAAPPPAAAPAPAAKRGSSEAAAGDEKPAKPKRASRAKKPRITVVENEPERPVLVALPPPPEPKGPRAVPNAKKRPPAHPPNRAGGNKTKRELPPYLRVVK